MVINVRHGWNVSGPQFAAAKAATARSVRMVAVLGADYPNIRPRFQVVQGDHVRTGQILFQDRRRPAVAITSPATGVVRELSIGRRRMLDRLVIEVAEDEFVSFASEIGHDEQMLRRLLLRSGAWASFRTRPFSRIPSPDDTAAAIFVTATEPEPFQDIPQAFAETHEEQLHLGLNALMQLTEGPVFFCHNESFRPHFHKERIRACAFAGPYPAALPGTHIHHLMPVSSSRTVWHIGYQDVVAIGSLLHSGRMWPHRVIGFTDNVSGVSNAFNVRAGCSLHDLVEDQNGSGGYLASGDVVAGRKSEFLGRYHYQAFRGRLNRTDPASGILASLFNRFPAAPPGAVVPLESLDNALPADIPVIPLIRALACNDVETAEQLGCLELAEDDVALLSSICPSRADHASLLRLALEELESKRR